MSTKPSIRIRKQENNYILGTWGNFQEFWVYKWWWCCKVALAVFIETVMVGKDKKAQFDMNILERVDDEEVFKNFDGWTFF